MAAMQHSTAQGSIKGLSPTGGQLDHWRGSGGGAVTIWTRSSRGYRLPTGVTFA
jgi:hypothetical protein